MEIRHSFGENLPGFDLQRTRDALAKYVELRWPHGRRKAVTREWGLSDDEARSVCTGRASWQTFDKIISHDRGGWTVLFPIFGALLNETAEQHIIKARKAHAEHAERLGALVGDWWPLGPDRSALHPDDAAAPGQRRRALNHRRAQGGG